MSPPPPSPARRRVRHPASSRSRPGATSARSAAGSDPPPAASEPRAASEPPAFVARSPDDVLALVPVVLGFVPAESLVVLTMGPGPAFHARIDLPGDPRHLPAVAQALVEPARRHEVRAVVLCVFVTRPQWGARASTTLARAFASAGIEVLDVLVADGERWWRPPPGGVLEGEGRPYDWAGHRFVAEAVLAGVPVRGSRAELAATIAPVPALRRRLGRVLAGEPTAASDRADGAALDPDSVRAELAQLAHHAHRPSDPVAARLLRAIGEVPVRDAVLVAMERERAREWTELWRDLTRRAPDEVLPPVATLLGFAAWLSGDGALAWCALDRVAEVAPAYRLAALLGDLLDGAVPPTRWEEVIARGSG